MKTYIQNLLNNPSKESIYSLDKEINKCYDIIYNYQDIIDEIIRSGNDNNNISEKANKIIEEEREYIEECRKIRAQIRMILNEKI